MKKKIAVLWPYLYQDFEESGTNWGPRLVWIIKALKQNGYEVQQHPNFVQKFPGTVPYKDSWECDLVIYNHAEKSEIIGEGIINAKKTWFFKPTVPDNKQTTLDELGYGSYSSPTYNKPEFEVYSQEEVDHFFNTKVKKWKNTNECKFGKNYFPKSDTPREDTDYVLILGQTSGDTVVERQDWGSYNNKLIMVIRELNSQTKDKIVVKLHPYTNGVGYDSEKDFNYIEDLTKIIKEISPEIEVISDNTSIHSLLPNAKYIMTANSGAGLEAMMYHKPIISFGFPEYHWITYDLRKVCDIHRAIKTDEWFDKELSDKYLYWYMTKYCIYNQASTNNRVKELLENE